MWDLTEEQSVPCGFTAAGLPIGMQITGKPFAEPAVLTVGQAHESATDWRSTSPPLRRVGSVALNHICIQMTCI